MEMKGYSTLPRTETPLSNAVYCYTKDTSFVSLNVQSTYCKKSQQGGNLEENKSLVLADRWEEGFDKIIKMFFLLKKRGVSSGGGVCQIHSYRRIAVVLFNP